MGLPRVLKNFNLHQDGGSWIGEVVSVTLPPLNRKLEEYRGAGMDSPIQLDMGGEAMELEFTTGGPIRAMIAAWGGTLSGTMLRFTGVYQNDDTGEVATIDVVVRGRYKGLELGEQKVGEVGGPKGTIALSYYRLDWDGATIIEVDPINMVLMIDGVDRLAEIRNAIR